ncbi:MAG: hypothetical protein LAP38_11220 [Acidobacteriia bacterium]|nr:hypothetical protein [Terriglobia bacterium]
MRVIFAAGFLATLASAFGQALIDPSDAAHIAPYFEPDRREKILRCEVSPIPPGLNFSFRFQTGYVFRVPMEQFRGPGHRWSIVTRVRPEGGAQPSYLGAEIGLPNVPKTKRVVEWGGFYWVGEGRYSVDFLLYDDASRICRKHWTMEAKLSDSERGITPGMTAGSVAQVFFRRWSLLDKTADRPTLRRLTVLMHAAPLFPRNTRFHAQDRLMLLGSLASLLESLPARSVRLVIFNLDQQRELFRQDSFTPEAFPQAGQSMNGLQLQLVDYSVLKNQRGHIDLLADLMNQELSARDPSDVVIFLGPPTRYLDKLPKTMLEERTGIAPRFFYFQYKPFTRPAAEFSDSIESAIKRVHGRTFAIHSAGEFAKAIRQVESQVAGER